MQFLVVWLQGLGLERYASVLAENEVDFEALRLLSEQDLQELGFPLGPRKKLLKAIADLNGAEMAGMGSGFRAAEPKPSPQPSTEGERRQLTVLFCDMVGFTELANRLDPEVLRSIIRSYEDACAVCVTRYEGYVFQRLGDGIVAFFGYPLAHEGEAERAIRAGLQIMDALSKLDVAAVGHLKVRIGIATGVVVVSSAEKGAVGETMNLAARLQAIAQPGSIVVSERVHRLAGGAFDYEDMGEQALKGISRPAHAFRILGVSAAASRFEAATHEGLTPLVGREQEIGHLAERWQLAQDGEGQVVLLSGEPGIGKSRILSALRERLEAQSARALRFQCSPYYVNSAFWPSVDNFERALKFGRDESPESKLDKLEALIVTHYDRPVADVRFIATILSIPCEVRYGALPMTPQKHKDETIRVLVDLTEAAARIQPSVMLFEDLHWADPTTLELLNLLIDRVRTIPLLIVLTHRPEFQSRWSEQGHVSALNLSKLTRAQSSAMVSRLTGGKELPAELLEQIVAKTDGVPLFVEELTKSILESTMLHDAGDHYEYSGSASAVTIPATLRDSLMARLDRFMPVKEIAQIGAAIGREFSYELIAAVAQMPRADLDDGLRRLTDSGLAFQRGTIPQATYIFKHALVQDAAYDSLLKSRRQELHGKIARVLETQFLTTKNSEPELLAHHYAALAHHFTEAGLLSEGIEYWARAGDVALQRSANVEAINHFTKGLELLKAMPAGEVDPRQELRLWLGLIPAYVAARGYSAFEVAQASARACELSEKLGDTEQYLVAIVGKFVFHLVRAELAQARAAVEAGLGLAQRIENPQLTAIMQLLLADVYYWQGHFVQATALLGPGLGASELFRERRLVERTGVDVCSTGLAYRAYTFFAMGYLDQSVATMMEAVIEAEKTLHANTIGHCLGFAGLLAVFCRDAKAARSWAGRTISYCRTQGVIFWEATAYVVDGWALIQEGQMQEGMERMRQGIALRRRAGANLLHPGLYAILAGEGHAKVGEFDEGLNLVAETLTEIERTGERTREAELYRVQGDLLLAKDRAANADQAASSFQRAIEVARGQQAKLFELRATVSLSRLLMQNGKRDEAQENLAAVYGWFTEGFDTKDLKDAKALLEELDT